MQKFKFSLLARTTKFTLKNIITRQNYVCFSSSNINLEKIQKATEEMKEQIKKELSFSDEGFQKLDYHETFLQQSGFSLKVIPESNQMKLLKKHDSAYYSYEIEIDFEARTKNLDMGKENEQDEKKKESDIEDEKEFYRDEDESDEDEEEEEKDVIEEQQEELFPRSDLKKGEESYETCEFQVYITSESIKGMLFFDCYSIESELNIRSATTIHDIEKFKSMKKEDRSVIFYHGPNFEHLDKRLQQSLKEYLCGFGINANLLKFLEGYSLYRDAQLYHDWLGKLQKFIER